MARVKGRRLCQPCYERSMGLGDDQPCRDARCTNYDKAKARGRSAMKGLVGR